MVPLSPVAALVITPSSLFISELLGGEMSPQNSQIPQNAEIHITHHQSL